MRPVIGKEPRPRATPAAIVTDRPAAAADRAGAKRPAAACACGGTCPCCRPAAPDGAPLPAALRAYFEPRFRSDFTGVRVRTGIAADSAARELGARAFTEQRDVSFAAGAYDPQSARGRRLLAHELAHVVQQRSVSTSAGMGSIARAEADATAAAARVLAGGPADVQATASAHVPLMQGVREEIEDETRARRAYERTRYRRDVGSRRYRDWDLDSWIGSGQAPQPMDQAATEVRLQSEIARLRPTIPEWFDLEGMAFYDSWFYHHGDQGPFDFRGRTMDGWEVNYYFVSMAMANQGWDWNETQGIIWAWNKSQEVGANPLGGGGDMTDEMWFASYQGYSDELERLASE